MNAQIVKMGIYSKLEDDKISPEIYKKKVEAWDVAWDHFQDKVPSAKSALEAELRKIMGDSTSV